DGRSTADRPPSPLLDVLVIVVLSAGVLIRQPICAALSGVFTNAGRCFHNVIF
ncbi:MAG: hypothetical protein Q9171_001992, partial [Xanthocarpia ochracea]